MRFAICVNCLSSNNVQACDVGGEKGSQRDPYRNSIDLCKDCHDFLVMGNLVGFHSRWNTDRTVTLEVNRGE